MLKHFVLFGLLLSTLTGCIAAQEVESLGIINARGVDEIDENVIETTLILFQFDSQSDQITKKVSGQGATVKSALNDANRESNFKLAPGKIELEIYGKETAEGGIFNYLDTLNRDATIPDNLNIAISDTTAKALLSLNKEDVAMNLGQYLHRIIAESSSDHLFPRVTLQDFISHLYDVGKDPVLTIFEIHDNLPKLSAIGLMQDDKLMGSLPSSDINLFNMHMETVKKVILNLDIPVQPFEKYLEKEDFIRIDSDVLHTSSNLIKSRSKTTLMDKDALKFKTKLSVKLDLLELSEKILLTDKQVIDILEKEFEKNIISRYETILAKMQELNTDAFGYGTIYRIHAKKNKLSAAEWRKLFPNIQVDFQIDVEIIQHGSIM